jgi:hypothetical protein
MTSFLLSGVFEGHQQPIVFRADAEVGIGTGIESMTVAPDGGLQVVLVAEIALSRLLKQRRAFAGTLNSSILEYGRSRFLLRGGGPDDQF